MYIKKQQEAADEIEILSVQLKEVIRQLRQGVSPDLAYALVYESRARLGRVTSSLGAGAPGRKKAEAIEILDSQTD